MKKINFLKLSACSVVIFLSISLSFAQKGKKPKAAVAAKPKPMFFAVMNDGKTLEPIGKVDKGELVAVNDENVDETKFLTSFVNTYYKPKTVYNLIFGGAVNGTVTVTKSNPKSECGKNLADVVTVSSKAKLKGVLMGLATNQKPDKAAASGLRRLPTPTERAEIEALVRGEFIKQGVAAGVAKELKYHNLTALDVDNDGTPEFVGSFWTETSATERNLLFFIAEKNKAGKYVFGYSNYEKVTPKEVMSGDLKDLDSGIGNELLLDAMEYNGDTTAEIFTVAQALEGNNFYVYSRTDGKWTRVFEGYNYHCAY